MKLRAVRDEDCKLLWVWRNDPEVKASAFESAVIPWYRHVAWFARRKKDSNCHMYIVLDRDDLPIGQVRLDIRADGSAETDVSIARAYRGRSYAAEAIELASAHLFRITSVTRIVAIVRPENMASIRTFENAGFVHRGTQRTKGVDAVKLVLPRPLT